MDIIIQTLYEIKENPIARIGHKSVTRLSLFLFGYRLRQMQEDSKFASIFWGFQSYIEEQYERAGNFAWDNILTAFCSSDEEAFDKFYEHLDTYLSDEDRLIKVREQYKISE